MTDDDSPSMDEVGIALKNLAEWGLAERVPGTGPGTGHEEKWRAKDPSPEQVRRLLRRVNELVAERDRLAAQVRQLRERLAEYEDDD